MNSQEVDFPMTGIKTIAFCFALCFGFIFCPSVYGQNLRQLLFKREAPVNSDSPESVLFRTFPIAQAKKIDVSNRSLRLLELLAENDGLPFAIRKRQTQVLREKQSDFDNAKLPFFVGAHATAWKSAILHLRGNEITIFPRALLANAQVSFAKLNANDLIFTLEIRSESFKKVRPISSLHQTRIDSDQVYRWFYQNLAKEEKKEMVQVNLLGPHMPTRLRGPFRFEHKTRPSLNTLLLASGLQTDKDPKIGQYFLESDKELLASEPVIVVLHRNVGAYRLKYVFPFEHAGSFSTSGQDYQKLFDQQLPSWHFDMFGGLLLMNGDIVELTIPQFVPLFSKVF